MSPLNQAIRDHAGASPGLTVYLLFIACLPRPPARVELRPYEDTRKSYPWNLTRK